MKREGLWCAWVATGSPKSYKRTLDKHPCRSGCLPQPAAVCLGICHQFLQMSGAAVSQLQGSSKTVSQVQGVGRRGSSVGRTLQKMDSGNSPPSSFLSAGIVVARCVTPALGLVWPITLWLVQLNLRNSFWLSAKLQERLGLACFLCYMSSP